MKTEYLPITILSVDEMNNLLAYCKKKKKIFLKEGIRNITFYQGCILQPKKTKIVAITEYMGKIAQYVTYLDGREDPQTITGGQAYLSLKKAWPQIPELDSNSKVFDIVSATPLIDYNTNYENMRIDAWGYDLNSAYAAAMLKGWIDASQQPQAKIIDEETEIGFDMDLQIQRSGYCLFVFKKMPTPPEIVEWVNKYYNIKKTTTDKTEKLKAKQTLNFAVGMLQRKNPWLRAWVVASCNEYISNLLDENSLFWNTDSIVSRVPRPDLEIGTEIGQWKVEHEGQVAYRGNVYQWNKDKPTYRGVPKTWFKGDYDLLVDEKPTNQNLFYFDSKEICIYGKDIIQ